MDQFIAEYPKAFLVILSGLVSFISFILVLFFSFFTASLRELTVEVKKIREDVKRDREKDRAVWGPMLDRITTQEVICQQHRAHCPWSNGDNNSDEKTAC